METMQWTTGDRSGYGRGPWDDEPDKMQYPDPVTGLPCLIVRVHWSGHLCGYVGVPPGHALHGRGYNELYEAGVDIEVHCGLTFADACTPHDPKRWEAFKAQAVRDEAEAKRYPLGDAAMRLKDAARQAALTDFDAYIALGQSSDICHIPGPGESDNVWWFGFDCAHCDDATPSDEKRYRDHGFQRDGTYKTVAYVRGQCANLARQLAAVLTFTPKEPHDE